MTPNLLEHALEYVRANPAVVAGVCLAVLIIGVTQAVVSASLTGGLLTTNLRSTYTKYVLVSRTRASHNSWLYRFALPCEDAPLGLPLGQHVSLRALVDGKEVRRPYTPVSSGEARGYFELLVKTYPAPHGTMSRHLESLRIGDFVEARGPLGRFKYARNAHARICMVAGGTGITPMWQILQAVLNDPAENTRISLVYANVTEGDILMRAQLDNLARRYRDRFDVFYVLNDPPAHWDGGEGFVTKEILHERFGEPSDSKLTLMCGPPPMNKAMRAALAQLGHKDDNIFKF